MWCTVTLIGWSPFEGSTSTSSSPSDSTRKTETELLPALIAYRNLWLPLRLLGDCSPRIKPFADCWFCPGPAVAALGTGLAPVFAFVAAMLGGMALHAWLRES